jgi:VWFA-related protein
MDSMKYFLSLVLLLQYTLSVDVDLAVFNVSVTDRSGRPVTGLTQVNFRILDEDQERPIKIFEPEDSPATVGLIIDNSGSMTRKRSQVVKAANAFVEASHLQDEVFIVNFNRRAWFALPASMPFTSNVQQLRTALLTVGADGTTALYDAVHVALKHLEKGTRQRKALVLLSDGADNASLNTLEEITKTAIASSATIYAIGLYDRNDRNRQSGVLRDLARVTGGRAYFPNRPEALHEVWRDIAGDLRGQYTIGFMTDNLRHDGSFRKVSISATDNRGRPLEVRTRPGYTTPASN